MRNFLKTEKNQRLRQIKSFLITRQLIGWHFDVSLYFVFVASKEAKKFEKKAASRSKFVRS